MVEKQNEKNEQPTKEKISRNITDSAIKAAQTAAKIATQKQKTPS